MEYSKILKRFLKKTKRKQHVSKFSNSTEFVNYCYETILGREGRIEELAHWINALETGVLSQEQVFIAFLNSEEYRNRQQTNSEFVPAGHFYSVVPSKQDRDDYLNQNIKTESIPGVELNENPQLDFLSRLKPYFQEFDFPENRAENGRYYWNNPAFTLADGLILYAMIRHFAPKKIIEVGSGFSSCLMLDVNDRYFGGNIRFTFVEPYPNLLQSLISTEDVSRHLIISKKMQDADISEFSTLSENDIVFIDSTHVSKLKSDVNHAFFHVLPILKAGVIVHFHDIYWPFENLRHWIVEGRAWNENYLMRAFLQYNDSFKILLFPSYLQQCQPDYMIKEVPQFAGGTAGSLWLQKIK